MNPYSPTEARTEALIDTASTDAATWHLSQTAINLLRCYDDLDAIENPLPVIEDAMATIDAELVDLRNQAIYADCASVDFGDDYQVQDAHDEMVEASAISVSKAMRLTRDAAVASIMRAAA